MEIAVIVAFVGFGIALLASESTAPVAGTGGMGSAPIPTGNNDNDNVPAPSWTWGAHMPITNDPATWPSGDTLWNVARAIALAEGAHVKGSAPDRNHNPGDISDGASIFGYDPVVSDSHVTHFPDKDTGWQWLYDKLSNIRNGTSRVYSPEMTWEQIAQKWAGNWTAWVTNVTAQLGVSPQSRFVDYTG